MRVDSMHGKKPGEIKQHLSFRNDGRDEESVFYVNKEEFFHYTE